MSCGFVHGFPYISGTQVRSDSVCVGCNEDGSSWNPDELLEAEQCDELLEL